MKLFKEKKESFDEYRKNLNDDILNKSSNDLSSETDLTSSN
jgi:hypothetical protein